LTSASPSAAGGVGDGPRDPVLVTAAELALSGGDRPPGAVGAVRGDCAAARQEFAGVVEDDDAVA